MRVWTGKGDDGTTGLLYGGRVRKDDPAPEAYGAVDEAQAALGVARADAVPGSELDEVLVHVERDLYVCMAELATAPGKRDRLEAGRSLVTPEMVSAVEERTISLSERFEMPSDFVLPGETRTSALLEVARTVVRRAERASVAVADEASSVLPYLNRLSSLLWALARWQEGEHHRLAKDEPVSLDPAGVAAPTADPVPAPPSADDAARVAGSPGIGTAPPA
ncbi:MAG: ATP:Cob(I)alamin adenosyltransferase [uncultured Acidimicrobiales bacterium]|uniref:Corrinoid adenosyltransferase n=1 Tax=uncultured Acidimicrobiales bacterium TaxID=310071 RepID=A0A6J4H6L8_9ACTN|nr:MAG: ATP:Cob(I)alamin adenosyltransferase [uncultured Acidimicrobiales bacterium]